MTDTTTPTPAEEQLALLRAEMRHYTAQAAKAEKEARWYPWIAIGLAVVGSVPLWGGVAAIAILASRYLPR